MRLVLTVVLLTALTLLPLACNKSRPRVLDYRAEGKEKQYRAVGLPGQSHVGAPESATRFTDDAGPGAAGQPEAKQDEQQPADKTAPEKSD